MSRRVLAVGILALWAISLGWLGARELGRRTGARSEEKDRTVSPSATYYTLSIDGTSVGFASTTVDTVPDGLTVDDHLFLEVPAHSQLTVTDVRTFANLSNDFELRTFDVSHAVRDVQFTSSGRIVDDTLLVVEIETDGFRDSVRIRVSRPLVLPPHAPFKLIRRQNLAVGDTQTVHTFDPVAMRHDFVSLRIEAESTLIVPDSAVWDSVQRQWESARWDTVHAWRVLESTNGKRVVSWIDDWGMPVAIDTPGGLSFARSAFETAFFNFRERDSVAARVPVGDSTVVRATLGALGAPWQADAFRSHLQVRLSGTQLDQLDLVGGNQTVHGDTVNVTAVNLDQVHRTSRLPIEDQAVSRYVSPDPLIQSDDPLIAAQARSVVGRTRNPRNAATRLTTWVHDELQPQPGASAPTASAVLDRRAGDPNDHALLFVALARAIGLPARVVSGLLYARGYFYYHTWSEVYVDDYWIAADPTLG